MYGCLAQPLAGLFASLFGKLFLERNCLFEVKRLELAIPRISLKAM